MVLGPQLQKYYLGVPTLDLEPNFGKKNHQMIMIRDISGKVKLKLPLPRVGTRQETRSMGIGKTMVELSEKILSIKAFQEKMTDNILK